MSKFKKKYCIASFLFAILVIVFTLTAVLPQQVYATSAGTAGSMAGSQAGDTGTTQDATSDNTNGLSITYNNS